MVDEGYRIFNCLRAGCHVQVTLCGRCDRGQRYCSRECAMLSRAEQVRAASAWFQHTPRGARLHAGRMQRCRERSKFPAQKVTQQSSTSPRTEAHSEARKEVDDARMEFDSARDGEGRPAARDERGGGSVSATAPGRAARSAWDQPRTVPRHPAGESPGRRPPSGARGDREDTATGPSRGFRRTPEHSTTSMRGLPPSAPHKRSENSSGTRCHSLP